MIFLLSLLFCAQTHAGGKVFTDLYVPLQNHYPNKFYEQVSTSIWLEFARSMSESLSGKVLYQGDFFHYDLASSAGDSRSNHLESRLREGYLSYSKSGWDIKLGQQIISWGKSDGVNPTDFHSAKNYNFLNPDDEVRRIGSGSLQGSFTPNEGVSPWTFTLVATPLIAQSKLLFPISTVPTNVSVGDPQSPPVKFENTEVGIKTTYNGQGWDASLSGFSGYSHLPELQEVSHTLSASPLVNLTQVFRKIWAVGADGSYSTDKWVFRGESAFIQTPNADGSNALIEPSHWDSVLGAERPLGSDFRIQGQLLLRYFPVLKPASQATGPDAISTQVNQLIAASNALLLQYQDSARPAATVRVSYSKESTGFGAEFFILENFNGGDYVIRPQVSYAWTDQIKTTVGSELYGGPTDKPLGALTSYSSVFAEAKYGF